jgi:hypothetical protein
VSFDDYADIRRNSKKKGKHLHLKISPKNMDWKRCYSGRDLPHYQIYCTTNMDRSQSLKPLNEPESEATAWMHIEN